MSNVITVDKRSLDDLIFQSCEQAATNLTGIPLRERAAFAIQAATLAMEGLGRIATVVQAAEVQAPNKGPHKAKPTPPPRARNATPRNVPPAPVLPLTPAASLPPSVLNAPLPEDVRIPPPDHPTSNPFASV
jgi:hypothetical protein